LKIIAKRGGERKEGKKGKKEKHTFSLLLGSHFLKMSLLIHQMLGLTSQKYTYDGLQWRAASFFFLFSFLLFDFFGGFFFSEFIFLFLLLLLGEKAGRRHRAGKRFAQRFSSLFLLCWLSLSVPFT